MIWGADRPLAQIEEKREREKETERERKRERQRETEREREREGERDLSPSAALPSTQRAPSLIPLSSEHGIYTAVKASAVRQKSTHM